MKKDISQEEIVIRLYATGKSIREVSWGTGMSRTYVTRILTRNGLYFPKKKNIVHKIIIIPGKGKYDHLLHEPRAQGMNYDEYLKKYGLHVNKYLSVKKPLSY